MLLFYEVLVKLNSGERTQILASQCISLVFWFHFLMMPNITVGFGSPVKVVLELERKIKAPGSNVKGKDSLVPQ